MVFVRVHRRAASVPVGIEPSVTEDTDLLAAKNSYWFSRAAIDNTDALSTASKRNDQQLLRDINNRIGTAPFSQPAPVRPTRRSSVVLSSSSASSPSIGRRRSIAVPSSSSSFSVLRPPLPSADDDVDVDYEVKLIAPLTNRLTRHGAIGSSSRATSVPPLSVVGSGARSVYGYETGYGHHPGAHVIVTGSGLESNNNNTPNIYSVEIPADVTIPTYQKLNPVADLAVRQAHSNLDRIEREIQSSGDVIISRPISPKTILYTASTDGPWRRSLSYHHGPPRTATVRTRSLSPAGRSPVLAHPPGTRRLVRTSFLKTATPIIADDDYIDTYLPSIKTDKDVRTELLLAGNGPSLYTARIHYPPPPSGKRPIGRSSGLTDALLYDLHLNSPKDIGVSPSLTTTSNNILNKVSYGSSPLLIHGVTHHTLPLHHTITTTTPHIAAVTPITLSHPSSSSSSSFTPFHSSLSNIPSPSSSVIVRPIPSVASSGTAIPPGLPPVVRPRVSETRRKVRDVLCKVKGDPHYFD